MSDANNTTKSYVSLLIQFIDGGSVTLKCPYSFYGQYITMGHSVFLEALSRTRGWFTIDTINGIFHAYRIVTIQSIHAEVIKGE